MMFSNAARISSVVGLMSVAAATAWPQASTDSIEPEGIRFGTGGSVGSVTEKMRITQPGLVGIGTTNPSTSLHISGTAGASVLMIENNNYVGSKTNSGLARRIFGINTANQVVFGAIDDTSADTYFRSGSNKTIYFQDLTATNMVISGDGKVGIGTVTPTVELHVVGDIAYTGVMSDVSDRRMKQDISVLDGAVSERLMLLKPVSFRMKDDDKREYGFIAQDVQQVFPELVQEGDVLSLNYIGLIAPAVKAIQILKRENEEQSDRIEALEEQNRLSRAQLKELRVDLSKTQRELARLYGPSDRD